MRTLPKHITIPNSRSYQVRITKDKIEHSLAFSWIKYGSPKNALAKAIEWRDAKLIELGMTLIRNDIRTKSLSHKKTKLPVGVTSYNRVDNRNNSNRQYLVFGVNFVKHNGMKTIKSFQVGNIETITKLQIKYAKLTAIAFRNEYEKCFRNNIMFNHEKYKDWPSVVFY